MQDINLSPIEDGGAYAVHCMTKADAIVFTDAMKKIHPKRTKNWGAEEVNWDVYYENTVYYPHFETLGSQMMYGRLDSVDRARYTIIPFTDLLRIHDLPIAQSDIPVASLLGL